MNFLPSPSVPPDTKLTYTDRTSICHELRVHSPNPQHKPPECAIKGLRDPEFKLGRGTRRSSITRDK